MGDGGDPDDSAERAVLHQLLELVDERVGAERADAVRAFARAYLRRMPDEPDGVAPAELLSEALGAFELAASRDGAPAAVRALNPTISEDGYAAPGAVLETNTEDLPFLVDSVTAELHARGLGIVRVLHPIIGTERDGRGGIVRVARPGDAAANESVMHFELDRRLDDAELAGLEEGVRAVLADVRRVVRDHAAMRDRVGGMIDAARAADGHHSGEEVSEAVAFLGWLLQGNFIFLGARDERVEGERLRGEAGTGLGLLDGDDAPAPPATLLDRAGDGLLCVDKSDELTVRAPPRADGRGRRAPHRSRRRHRRRVAPGRPVHEPGLCRAGQPDADAARQAAHRAVGRGADRGLARLQGRRRPVRLVPQGGAVQRPDGRPAPRGRRAARCVRAPAACACSPAATPTTTARR